MYSHSTKESNQSARPSSTGFRYLRLNRLKKVTKRRFWNPPELRQHLLLSCAAGVIRHLSEWQPKARGFLSSLFSGMLLLSLPAELILVRSLRGPCAVCQLNLFPTRVLSTSARKLLSAGEESRALSLPNSRGATGGKKLCVMRSLWLIAGSASLSLAPVCLWRLFFAVAVKTGWYCVRLWVIRGRWDRCGAASVVRATGGRSKWIKFIEELC